jgi:DNA-binding transcriptional LysR family regulator
MLIGFDIDRLKTFWAVATEKSFSRAAEKLFRTQSAVSQAVRLLEREVGEILFLRLGRTTELTPAGRILLEHVEDAFCILEKGRARVRALKELQEGELTIAASDTTTCYMLPKTLAAFRRRYPKVEVRILNRPSPVAAELVAAHDADVGIVTLPIEHPKLASEPIQVREDVAVCAARHPLARRTKASLAELLRYPLILLDRGSNTRSFIDRTIEAAGLTPNVAMEVGSIEVIKRLVELDFGVSIVPRVAVQQEVKQETLKAIRLFGKDDWRVMGIVYPRKGMANVAAEAFADLLRKEIKCRAGTLV